MPRRLVLYAAVVIGVGVLAAVSLAGMEILLGAPNPFAPPGPIIGTLEITASD